MSRGSEKMFGLGKSRTKLGRWLDKKGISQEWVSKKSGVSRDTISDLANDRDRLPTTRTIKKIMKAIREIDPKAKSSDFFDI